VCDGAVAFKSLATVITAAAIDTKEPESSSGTRLAKRLTSASPRWPQRGSHAPKRRPDVRTSAVRGLERGDGDPHQRQLLHYEKPADYKPGLRGGLNRWAQRTNLRFGDGVCTKRQKDMLLSYPA
jgi:hypothetical protein